MTISLVKFVAASTLVAILTPPSALAQSCQQVNEGIAGISSEINQLKADGAGDNSVYRAILRTSKMEFGAQAQANLMTYGKTLGCKFSGLSLPTSIGGKKETGDGGL